MKIILSAGLALASSIALADFDKPDWCGKAKSKAEKIVCNDAELSAAAIKLDKRWDAFKAMNSTDYVRAGHALLHTWNKDIFQPCGDKDCIEKAYHVAFSLPQFSDQRTSFDFTDSEFVRQFNNQTGGIVDGIDLRLRLKDETPASAKAKRVLTYDLGESWFELLLITDSNGKVDTVVLTASGHDGDSEIAAMKFIMGEASIIGAIEPELTKIEIGDIIKREILHKQDEDGRITISFENNGVRYTMVTLEKEGLLFSAMREDKENQSKE